MSNLNKDTSTFNTKEQIYKKSLMMSEISQKIGNMELGQNKGGLASERNDIMMRSINLGSMRQINAGNDKQIMGSLQLKVQKLHLSSDKSESQISMSFPAKQMDLTGNNKELLAMKDGGFSDSGLSAKKEKEMQSLKYISEGGILIKRNLFDDWFHIYEKEVQYLDPKEAQKANIQQSPVPSPVA